MVVPEIQEQRVQAGDLLLLCSDGLTTMLGDERILSIVRAAPDLETGCEQLVAAANDAGGEDNVTIILARLTPE